MRKRRIERLERAAARLSARRGLAVGQPTGGLQRVFRSTRAKKYQCEKFQNNFSQPLRKKYRNRGRKSSNDEKRESKFQKILQTFIFKNFEISERFLKRKAKTRNDKRTSIRTCG